MNKASAAHALARLRAVGGFVFDLDGTLVLGDKRNALQTFWNE